MDKTGGAEALTQELWKEWTKMARVNQADGYVINVETVQIGSWSIIMDTSWYQPISQNVLKVL